MAFLSLLSLAAIGVIVIAVAYGFVRKTLQTLTLGVAILLVFALQFIPQGLVTEQLQLSWIDGGLSAPYTWITYQFLHFNPGHLFFNLLALLLIAPSFEERIGSARFAVLYFAGGVVGAAGFVALNLSTNLALIGASASISAIFGGYGRLYPRDRVRLFLPIPGIPALPVIEVVIGFLLIETALSVFSPYFGLGNIAWQAHVVAMAFGFAAAPLIMRIPIGSPRLRRLAPLPGWQALAVTPDLQRILEEAERSDLPELREAWLEKLVRAAKCPRCGGPLRRRLGRVRSRCGWSARIR